MTTKTATPAERRAALAACKAMLDEAQRTLRITRAGSALDVHMSVNASFAMLAPVVNDRPTTEAFGRYAINLCRIHGTLTPAQAAAALDDAESRYKAGLGAITSLVAALHNCENAACARDELRPAGVLLN